jgi:hypothetical protein
MLDPLPTEWEGHQIASDFRIGIQIANALTDPELTEAERIGVSVWLLFGEMVEDGMDALGWFLNGWNTDNDDGKHSGVPVMSFDIDQWRIIAAFRSQYGIDLTKDSLHYWLFMALLVNLQESAFTKVIDVRTKKIPPKASAEEKAQLREAKRRYSLAKEEMSASEKAAREEARDLFLATLKRGR